MQIASFLPHYQLVYISFDISSFSLISYVVKHNLLLGKRLCFARQKTTFCKYLIYKSLQRRKIYYTPLGSLSTFFATSAKVLGTCFLFIKLWAT